MFSRLSQCEIHTDKQDVAVSEEGKSKAVGEYSDKPKTDYNSNHSTDDDITFNQSATPEYIRLQQKTIAERNKLMADLNLIPKSFANTFDLKKKGIPKKEKKRKPKKKFTSKEILSSHESTTSSEKSDEYKPTEGTKKSSSSNDTEDFEAPVCKKSSKKTKEKPNNSKGRGRVLSKPKRRPKIVVNRENENVGIPAVYEYAKNSFLPEPATVMQDSSLPSNDIMVVRNPTEACFFIYRDIDIPMDEALKQIHKREFKKHFMSQNSKMRQSNDGCEGFLFYGTKILPGTTNQIYRVGALQRKTFMHRELRSIIVQYFGDFEYTLDNDDCPKPYKLAKCPENEMRKNLPADLRVKVIRHTKGEIVITKREARGRTQTIKEVSSEESLPVNREVTQKLRKPELRHNMSSRAKKMKMDPEEELSITESDEVTKESDKQLKILAEAQALEEADARALALNKAGYLKASLALKEHVKESKKSIHLKEPEEDNTTDHHEEITFIAETPMSTVANVPLDQDFTQEEAIPDIGQTNATRKIGQVRSLKEKDSKQIAQLMCERLLDNGFKMSSTDVLLPWDKKTDRYDKEADLDDIPNYQQIGFLTSLYVVHKLVYEHGLDLQELKDGTNILCSQNLTDSSKPLLILVNGMPPATLGIWSREVCLKQSLHKGSVIPYVKDAVDRGMNVIVMNTNKSITHPKQKKPLKINSKDLEQSNLDHATAVWDEIVRKTATKKIYFVAHSRGGSVVKDLAKMRLKEFVERVEGIKLTDSAHTSEKRNKTDLCKFLSAKAVNYVTSDKQVGTPFLKTNDYIPAISSGHKEHKMTSHTSRHHIFESINLPLAVGNSPKPNNPTVITPPSSKTRETIRRQLFHGLESDTPFIPLAKSPKNKDPHPDAKATTYLQKFHDAENELLEMEQLQQTLGETNELLDEELISISQRAAEAEPTSEVIKQFLNQPQNKPWTEEAMLILRDNELGERRKVTKRLFIKKAQASLIIPPNFRLTHSTVEKLMVAAKKHNVLIDASENNITMPMGGELYIFDCEHLSIDWKEHILCDGHHWKIKYAINPVGANFDKRQWLTMNQEKVQSYEFVRYAFYNTNSKVLLVHYIGDEKKSGEYLHGNSKKKRNIFVRTSKIVKDNVNASNYEKSTSKIYDELTTKANAATIEVSAPRDTRAVEYNRQQTLQKDKLHANEIASTFITAGYLGSFVIDMHIAPHMVIGCVTDRGAAELKRVCEWLGKKGKRLVMHYDTTFQYGDYYVTILSYRHPYIEKIKTKTTNINDQAIVPLAVIFHHKKAQFVHKTAMDTVTRRLDEGHPDTRYSFTNTLKVIISDREFVGSDLFPNARTLWCHIHLQKNCKEKARSLGYKNEEAIEIGHNVVALLRSTCVETYTERKNEFLQSKLWSKHNFNKYYAKNIDKAITTGAARWLIEEYGIEHADKGITNNPAETLNSVLHHLGGKLLGTQTRIDKALMKVKYFMDSKDIDINHAYYAFGNYQIKDKEMPLKNIKNIPTYQLLTPEEMIQEYREMMEPGYERQFEESPMKLKWENVQKDTVENIAQFYVDNGLIRSIPFTQFCLGINPVKSFTPFVVNLQTNKCYGCTKKDICPHLLACNILQKGDDGVKFQTKEVRKKVVRTTFASPTAIGGKRKYGSKKPKKADEHHASIHGSQDSVHSNYSLIENPAYTPTSANKKTRTTANNKTPKSAHSKTPTTPKNVTKSPVMGTPKSKRSIAFKRGRALRQVKEIEGYMSPTNEQKVDLMLKNKEIVKINNHGDACFLLTAEKGMSVVEYRMEMSDITQTYEYCNVCQKRDCLHVECCKVIDNIGFNIREKINQCHSKIWTAEEICQVIEYFQTGKIKQLKENIFELTIIGEQGSEKFKVVMDGSLNGESEYNCEYSLCAKKEGQESCSHVLAALILSDIEDFKKGNWEKLQMPEDTVAYLTPYLIEVNWRICDEQVPETEDERMSKYQNFNSNFCEAMKQHQMFITQRKSTLNQNTTVMATPIKSILKGTPSKSTPAKSIQSAASSDFPQKSAFRTILDRCINQMPDRLAQVMQQNDFNEAFILEEYALQNNQTPIATVSIKNLDNIDEVTPLPSNQARNYEITNGNHKFTIYSPLRGDVVFFTDSKDKKILEKIKNIAAEAVKHGADRSYNGKEFQVEVYQYTGKGKVSNVIEQAMKHNELLSYKVPRKKLSDKTLKTVHCYCNSILTDNIELRKNTIMSCLNCKSRYHVQCLSTAEKNFQTCTPCTANHAILWGAGPVKNTCPIDGSFQGLLLLLQENNYKFSFPFPKDEAHKVLTDTLNFFTNSYDEEGQMNWYKFLKKSHPDKFEAKDNYFKVRKNKDFDMHGTPADMLWQPLEAGGSLTYESHCTNSRCLRPKGLTKVFQLPTIPDQNSEDDLQKVIEIWVDGQEKHGKGLFCLKCKDGYIVKSPLKLQDPKNNWFINFEGTETGFSKGDNQTELMKLKPIMIDGVVFEPRIIMSNLDAMHYVSLVKFNQTWLNYDDMMPNIHHRLMPPSPALYENCIFSNITFIRKPHNE